jgi:hypothetical protein
MLRSRSITSRLGHAAGFALVAACLVLSLPGVRAVRADDEPGATATFEDFASHAGVDASAPAPAADPSCQAGAASVTPQGVEQQIQAEVVRMKATAAGVKPVGDSQVILLNNRGYNYGPADRAHGAGPAAPAPAAKTP